MKSGAETGLTKDGTQIGDGMRILVTGAAGFLGRAPLRALAQWAPDDQIGAMDLAPRRPLISFKPDERIEALFGRAPELSTAREEALGFAHDGTPNTLIKEALTS